MVVKWTRLVRLAVPWWVWGCLTFSPEAVLGCLSSLLCVKYVCARTRAELFGPVNCAYVWVVPLKHDVNNAGTRLAMLGVELMIVRVKFVR